MSGVHLWVVRRAFNCQAISFVQVVTVVAGRNGLACHALASKGFRVG